MYKRLFDIEKQLDEAMFLFGARQVGKSTLLQERFEDAVYYDLLLPNIRKSFKRNPELFKEALSSKPAGTLVIVDEIQKVPELLDLVHWLMVNKGLRFILSGSSARKLKKSGANTLGGRAQPRTLFPLVWPEVSDFQIDKAVQNGMIPRHYLADDATDRLEAYVDVYIKEEILDEASVQDIDAFERFMEVAAISDGEMLNYSNIATDCGVSAKTVKSYYQILYDTMLGYEIPAYRKVIKRQIVQAPKFYYFDVGLSNYLMGRHNLKRGSDDYGHAFEHFVMQEIIAYKGYCRRKNELSYWHTYNGKEVDAVIGDAEVAIEIKSCEQVKTKHKAGLKAFKEEHPECRLILVSLDPITRVSGDKELIYVT
ncbi:MAG: ATP-binding protein, partial [Bacteroidales bacterium]|nr:ATP-binding protein [Candidatus Cryptobacteroides fimicaballi]